ncbi:MAG: hypothetical protein ACYCO9_03020 [Streptosporangiaceae bacterium]
MPERDDRYARQDLPSNTAEFRATPDVSASTAQFQAFAAAHDARPDQPWKADAWPEQPAPGAPRAARRGGRTALLAAGAIVVLAIVITVIVIASGG